VVAPFMPDDEKLAAVRAGLPALGAGIYLNTGSVGPLPAETAAAMDEYAARELSTGRAHPADFEMFLERMAEARAGIAAVLGGDVEDIALTHSSTDALNIAAWSIPWQPGDRALTTSHEHAGGLGPLIAVRDRFGVGLDIADIGDGGDADGAVAAIERALRPETRLILVSHVAWTTGARLPVERIAELARSHGVKLAVDGAQAVGAVPVSIGEIGADFYAIPGQKWLLGPEGTGAVWVSREARETAAPGHAGWFSFDRIGLDGSAAFHSDARRFEASNYHRPSVVGLARSCGWLSMYVGLPWIHARGATLARRAADRLAEIPGLTLITPRSSMATLVTFRLDAWPPEAALDELGSRVFAIARTIPALDAIRISVGFFTSEEELERFFGAVELLARHTPESLPPRPRLTILNQAPG
jgi:L-cysteine/cystine lyase